MQIKEFIWDLSDYTGWADGYWRYSDVAIFMNDMLHTIKRIRSEGTMAAYLEWQAHRIERFLDGTQDTHIDTENLYVMRYIMRVITQKLRHINERY